MLLSMSRSINIRKDRSDSGSAQSVPHSYKAQSAHLASSVASRKARQSFSSGKAFSHIDEPVIGASSPSHASAYSVDIENPDPEVVKVVGKHLVDDDDTEEDKFRSLKLQGGDITRQLYNWRRDHEGEDGIIKRGRSRSFDIPKPPVVAPNGEALDAKQMLAPGGFRREYITHKTVNPTATTPAVERPTVFTRNFIEFLSLYGHFAGEDLEEEEDEDEDEDEQTPLIRTQSRPRLSRKLSEQSKGQASVLETVMLLLKSFVGTGILFLPRAFYNGGLLFSSLVLCFVSAVSYWCFLLLVSSKKATQVSSFGDIGGMLYGNIVRQIILSSIVLSQIGFASAYIVFVSENFRSFWHNIGKTSNLSLTTLIAVQIIIFLPLSMIRDIAKLGFTALIADAFILLGIIYLYGWGSDTIINHGVADVVMLNKRDWPLFIGTAIFTFEGVGLIIPIEESMKQPQKFSKVLAWVMVGITIVFVSIGALLYMACGSSVHTVILLNLPEGSAAVCTIQLLYSLAILLSTPLQLFPGIRIVENWLFVRSGKFSRKVKWEKNFFRFIFVVVAGFIAFAGAGDLDKFVALVGAFACVPLVYIYPPLLHMKVVASKSFAWYLDLILLVFGTCVMIYTSISTIQSWIN